MSRIVRALLIPTLALSACGGPEHPTKRASVTASALPAVTASSAVAASDTSYEAHRLVRGALIRTHVVVARLLSFTKPCDADGGPCRTLGDLQASRTAVATRLDEARAFAASHTDALPAETQCLASVLDQTDRLISATQSHAGEEGERDELAKRLDHCRETFAPVVAAYGAPFPKAHDPSSQTHGRLPPSDIQKLVRQNFGRFKLCYTATLKRDPAAGGRVEPEFIIDVDGSVADARMLASTVADKDMNDCIVRTILLLRFPPPPDGYVTVGYPLIFSPGNP